MKLTALFVVILAVLSLLAGTTEAAPKVNVNAIKKGGKIVKKGLGAIGAAGTAHEIYSHVKNRRH